MSEHGRVAQAGFTLIEVMIAIGIMTVGSLGILAMHQGVSQANRAANEMNTALAITDRWIERIERDALTWTEEGETSPTLSGTNYLAPLSTTVTTSNWIRPPVVGTDSYGFDHFGNDLGTGLPLKYCTNIQLSWLRLGNSARVDIRTYWYREGHMVGSATHPDWVAGATFQSANCAAAAADGWGLSTQPVPNVDVIHASTVVTWLRREM